MSGDNLRPSPGPPEPTSRGASPKLEFQAAAAALCAVQSGDNSMMASQVVLDESNRRLSAVGAAVSLKYAKPKDLPSFPSLGLPNSPSSAGAAASLASSPRKLIPCRKADPSPSAFAAAVHVKDLMSTKPWQPQPSTQGVKAALVAHTRNVKPSPPSNPTSPQNTLPSQRLSPRSNHRYTTTDREVSLQTATDVIATKRRRSGSAPMTINNTTWSGLASSAADALNAATIAHSPTVNRNNTLPHSAVGGNAQQAVISSHLLFKQEPADKKGADVRAAAVSMARQLSGVQQSSTNDTEELGGEWSRLITYRPSACPPPTALTQSGEHVPVHSNNLQEAASKLAQERLARLHVEHEAYRSRRRAFSLGKSAAQGGKQSGEMGSGVPLFTGQVAQVDAEKLERDRKALITAAQKNVQESMHKMDEEILFQTGRLPPPTQEKWGALAIAAAEAESVTRMSNYGKISIGGGKFIDQGEVDAVAARNVQPLLDEINTRAEKRKEEIRLEQEKKRHMIEEKLRVREPGGRLNKSQTKGLGGVP